MSDFKNLSALLQKFAENSVPGCGCAVSKDGKIVYEDYFGKADIESGRPITEDTVYRLASMTKVVACTAALTLFERGEFLLNEPLYEYIPEYKNLKVVRVSPNGGISIENARSPLLIKHAFTMTAGLPYAYGDSPTAAAIRAVREKLSAQYGAYDLLTEVKAMAEVPLAFEPGTHWLYGYGHDLVAALITVITGKSLSEFLKAEVFEPLEMTDTGYRYFGNTRERMAVMYNKKENGVFVRSAGFMDNFHEPGARYEAGGAGLFSTVKDYLAFTIMLANGGTYKGRRIIGSKTIDLMRSNHLAAEQLQDFTYSYTAGYGYGLGVRTMMNPAAGHCNGSVGEFGWTGMCGTYTAIDPQERFSLVYMHQMSPNEEERHHLRVRAAAYGGLSGAAV